MTLFVGPVAPQGGPAIKNSITLKYLFPDEKFTLVNTYGQSLTNRVKSVLRTALSRDEQVVIAVSKKGRSLLWPILHWKSTFSKQLKYSLICIGGTIAEEASDNPRYVEYMNKASVVSVETVGVKDKLEKLGVNNVHVMTNFVDGLIEKRVPSKLIGDQRLKFVFLSSVRNSKGIATMLSAFRSSLNDGASVSLDIYGPIKADFDQSLFDGLDCEEWINYRGVVENSEVVKTLCAYDCFVFPSEYSMEGFPAVLAEAQAAGLPVIASDICYNGEIVKDGVSGWLFRAGDEEGLRNLICKADSSRNKLNEFASHNSNACVAYDAAFVVGDYKDQLRKAGWTL